MTPHSLLCVVCSLLQTTQHNIPPSPTSLPNRTSSPSGNCRREFNNVTPPRGVDPPPCRVELVLLFHAPAVAAAADLGLCLFGCAWDVWPTHTSPLCVCGMCGPCTSRRCVGEFAPRRFVRGMCGPRTSRRCVGPLFQTTPPLPASHPTESDVTPQPDHEPQRQLLPRAPRVNLVQQCRPAELHRSTTLPGRAGAAPPRSRSCRGCRLGLVHVLFEVALDHALRHRLCLRRRLRVL